MVKAVVDGVRFAGFQAAVPADRHSFLDDPAPFTREEAEKLAASTGVRGRRVLPPHLCASDLCVAAAEGLLAQIGWEPGSIDVLVFVSQDADYNLPATACVIQQHLGLSTSCAAFDVNLGCSGFVYGTWIAARLLSGIVTEPGRPGRALVLCGDTSTRHLRPDDRSTLPLFGDAGSATALERDETAGRLFVVAGTDGAGASHIRIKAGGRRDSLVPPTAPRSPEEEERLFRDARLHLNGAEVFGFTLKAVPPLVRQTLDHAGTTVDAIDWCVMHQANKFMLDHLRKKTGFPEGRFVVDMEEFGNTSSASIPLAISHRLSTDLAEHRRRVLLAGFGVGWSWGALVGDIGPLPPPAVVEVGSDRKPMLP
ncbi:3-oxoacyl-ACP synthase III family protein [Azospirillum agricola]|uniref:3-oxoacyl-ACP synthase III family protein n=1 Tax=Azospirillum agricola TaxID=1720247 RepID=UPI000A0F00C8|nr:ketoacyl-ACP synthase III [Azospirillum agricola]SMH41633.1 3-oxoacyl-[acyl-carrier-protein] synthase-3 [Azospirillum lipoferum]